jgi:hypothetical protein
MTDRIRHGLDKRHIYICKSVTTIHICRTAYEHHRSGVYYLSEAVDGGVSVWYRFFGNMQKRRYQRKLQYSNRSRYRYDSIATARREKVSKLMWREAL